MAVTTDVKFAACEIVVVDPTSSSSKTVLSMVGNGEYSSEHPINTFGLKYGFGHKNSLGLDVSVFADSLDCEPTIDDSLVKPNLFFLSNS